MCYNKQDKNFGSLLTGRDTSVSVATGLIACVVENLSIRYTGQGPLISNRVYLI